MALRCHKMTLWPKGLCCTASWHGAMSCVSGLLGNVCAEVRGCRSHCLRPVLAGRPWTKTCLLPLWLQGWDPPARSQTLASQCGDVVPGAGLGREPVEHSSSSQPGSHGDFCSVVFYSEMIVTVFFFFFFNIYISKG